MVGRDAEVETGGVGDGSGRSPGPGSSTTGDAAEESRSEGGCAKAGGESGASGAVWDSALGAGAEERGLL